MKKSTEVVLVSASIVAIFYFGIRVIQLLSAILAVKEAVGT